MPQRHRPQGPDGVLKALAQTGEALRKAQSHMFPVRIRQHKMVGEVREWLTRDRHRQIGQVCEIRRPQPSRLVKLREHDFLLRARQGTPPLHPTLHGPQQPVVVLSRMTLLEHRQQRVRLQLGSTFQLSLQLRPHRCQWIHTCPPRPFWPPLSWHLPLPVLPCRLPIHVGLHGRLFQRRALV
jgi:hypothetical protein